MMHNTRATKVTTENPTDVDMYARGAYSQVIFDILF